MFRHQLFICLLLLFGFFTSLSSCSRKTGCPANEALHAQTNRKGELSDQRGTTHLFPKKMRKNRP